ncbi:MAG: transcription termination factor NusA [Clostridiaceae bacterium]
MARVKKEDKNSRSAEIINALKEISLLKGIEEELLFTTLEDALTAAYKKNYQDTNTQDIKSTVDREKGAIKIVNRKKVVEEVEDGSSEISLEDAKAINPIYAAGDVVEVDVTPDNFMRVAAQSAKQIVTQRIKEAERSIIYNEFSEKEFDLISGIVQRKDKGNVYVDLGKIEAVIGPSEQIPGEEYEFNERIQLYIVEVKQNTKGPLITVSRTHPGLVKRLFEREVPEIFDGVVEIKSIAREPGSRTKIAVHSNDENVDATGSCVGNRGSRVQNVVNELKNEKIDIVEWNKEPALFIANALSPAKVKDVFVNEDEKSARVIVEDSQLSLAIGKEGQNVRLAAKLTNWKIDIKSDKDKEAYNVDTLTLIPDKSVLEQAKKEEE